MNRIQCKNNLYKSGDYNSNHSICLVKDKIQNIEPTNKQAQYLDALYKFCVQKGLVRDSFKIGRTRQGMRSTIKALITILQKNGLADEFFGRNEQPVEVDNG